MTDSTAISQYCERVDPGFWAEPVNAGTNAAFLVAALLAARRLRGLPALAVWELWLLVALLAAIGVGSFLWHTLATPWAQAADVLPIMAFTALFLASYLARGTDLPWAGVAVLWLAFEAVNFGLPAVLPADLLNGSVFYLPTWAALGLLAVDARRAGSSAAAPLALALGLFTVSLVLRTVDPELCGVFPLGTHFGWHLLNGAVLFFALEGLRVAVALPGPEPRGTFDT